MQVKTSRVISEVGDKTHGGEQEGDQNKSTGQEIEAASWHAANFSKF